MDPSWRKKAPNPGTSHLASTWRSGPPCIRGRRVLDRALGTRSLGRRWSSHSGSQARSHLASFNGPSAAATDHAAIGATYLLRTHLRPAGAGVGALPPTRVPMAFGLVASSGAVRPRHDRVVVNGPDGMYADRERGEREVASAPGCSARLVPALRWTLVFLDCVAAIDHERLAGDVARALGGKKRGCLCHLVWPTAPAKRGVASGERFLRRL